MTRISLLPSDLRKRQRSQENRDMYIKIGVGVVAVFLILFASLFLLTLNVNRELDAVRNQRQLVDQQIAQLREYEIIATKISDLDNLGRVAVGQVPDWSGLLISIGEEIPAGVYLTDFTGTQIGEDRVMTLKGMAPSHVMAAEWLEELLAFEKLDDVSFQISSETLIDGQPRFVYEIKAAVIPEEPESPLERGGM